MKLKIFIAITVILIPISFWIGDVVNDRAHKLVVKENIGLFKTPEEAAYSGTPIETINKNENVVILRITYGKDYMAIKVETINGSVGWIIADKDIKLIKPEET